MVRKSGEEPTVSGPVDPAGGTFVLIEEERPEAPADQDEVELAQGSDVHDVEALERQLGVESLDDVLKAYLDEES